MKSIANIPGKIAVGLINIYQALLSPDHSWLKARYPNGYCRHYPSCSEYSKQAIEKFGVLKGGLFAINRVLKCNPFVESKIDLVP